MLEADLNQQGWSVQGETRTSLRVRLTQTDEELLASFRKATRYEIRRAERERVDIRPASCETELRGFQGMYTSMAAAKGFAAEESSRLLSILRWLVREPHRGTLLLAFKDGKMLGGTVVARAAKRTWYVFGATAKDEHFSSGHLLQWRGMQWARERGCLEHDLGGYREDANTGPALFKRGFSQSVVHFVRPYRFVTNRALYSLEKRIVSVKSAVSTAKFRRAKP